MISHGPQRYTCSTTLQLGVPTHLNTLRHRSSQCLRHRQHQQPTEHGQAAKHCEGDEHLQQEKVEHQSLGFKRPLR